MTFLVRTTLALLAVAAIAGLALMPTPYVSAVGFVPRPLADWADGHDFDRNVLGGAVLQAAVLGLGWRWFCRSGPLWLWFLAGWGFFALLEGLQIFLPGRSPDGRDIAAAALGAATVAIAAWGVRRFLARKEDRRLRGERRED